MFFVWIVAVGVYSVNFFVGFGGVLLFFWWGCFVWVTDFLVISVYNGQVSS